MKQLNGIILIIILLVVGVLAYGLAQKAINNQAIDGCLGAGIAKFKNGAGQDVEVPEEYWYEFCMKEKGLERK
jgi:hypothetical protein